MQNEQISIIIPTYNNPQILNNALKSLIRMRSGDQLMHIYVINNGEPHSCDFIEQPHKFITLIQPEKNLGWEGGLIEGLKHSKAEFVMFLNDDILVTDSEVDWLLKMLQHFRDPKVAAVGAGSNMVMGFQNMIAMPDLKVFTTTFLIGFCMLLRRTTLNEVGGVDDTLPGGDDLDLSIRLRDAGYKLIIDRRVFVFHYGSQTGNKLHGDATKSMGWNSPEMTERTNFALIKKHGFKKWWECIKGAYALPSLQYSYKKDSEGDLIRKKVKIRGLKVIDIGCGNLKTFKNSVGLDIVPGGEIIDQIGGESPSKADITCDVSQPLPLKDNSVDVAVARHILEHMIDPITAVRNWIKPLKKGGRLIISVPNEHLLRSIPMNPEHVHAWTPEWMEVFIDAVGGLKKVDMWDSENQISFTSIWEKI